MGYLPAGFPTTGGAIEAALAIAAAGADVIEIGLPYSDPLMDGPVIQEAVHRALTGGVRVTDVLRTVEAVAECGVPVLVMTYWNPVDHYGVRAFARDLASAGGCGMITPDLTPEEAQPWLQAAAEQQLDPVFLVGTTGARESVGSEAAGLVRRVRACTDLPVAVGLGVRDRAQAAEVAGFADGVIVGSAFVARMLAAADQAAAITKIRDLAADLAAGVRSRPARGG